MCRITFPQMKIDFWWTDYFDDDQYLCVCSYDHTCLWWCQHQNILKGQGQNAHEAHKNVPFLCWNCLISANLNTFEIIFWQTGDARKFIFFENAPIPLWRRHCIWSSLGEVGSPGNNLQMSRPVIGDITLTDLTAPNKSELYSKM